MDKLFCLLALGAIHFPSSVTGCKVSSSQISAIYGPGDGFWRIELAWSSENPDCKVHLEEQVDGKEEFQRVESRECIKGKYCYFKTRKQCCTNGKMEYKSMKFSTECSCHVATFTFTIKSLLTGNSSRDCEYIIPPGETSVVKVDNMEFRECGEPCLVKIPRNCSASGCYCKNYVLNKITGLCSTNSCPETFKPIPLNLKTPGCVKLGLGELVQVTWEVDAKRMYTYTIRSSGVVRRSGTLPGKTDQSKGFNVVGKVGTLTIPSAGLGQGQYSFEVEDIYSDVKNVETDDFSIKVDCLPSIPIILSVPECNRFISGVTISWNAQSNREYGYKITELMSNREELSGTLTGKGIVTIPGRVLKVGNYSVTVEDLRTENKSMNSTNFEIKAGCKPIRELAIDGEGRCVHRSRFSYLEIYWKVEEDRTYKYLISKEGTIEKEATVPGSGNDDFLVDNGRGQVTLELKPGDYTVAVQDLDAGVREFYSESKNFTVKACNFEIETSNCIEKGQTVTVSLLAFPNRTYEFSVLVEKTAEVVLNGSFISGVSQNGMTTYDLDSSDSLPVGRYSVLIREVETGGEGYGKFVINSYGEIGKDVKYRADPLPDGLYVCLHPRKGRIFASDLTYKTNDGIGSSLHGPEKCLEEVYGGGQGTLEITIKKDGEMAGKVDIDYVG